MARYLEIKVGNVTTFCSIYNIELIQKETYPQIKDITPIKCTITLKHKDKPIEFYMIEDTLDLDKLDSINLKIVGYENLQSLIDDIENYQKHKQIRNNKNMTFSISLDSIIDKATNEF